MRSFGRRFLAGILTVILVISLFAGHGSETSYGALRQDGTENCGADQSADANGAGLSPGAESAALEGEASSASRTDEDAGAAPEGKEPSPAADGEEKTPAAEAPGTSAAGKGGEAGHDEGTGTRAEKPGMTKAPGRPRSPERAEKPGMTKAPGRPRSPGRAEKPGMTKARGRPRSPGRTEPRIRIWRTGLPGERTPRSRRKNRLKRRFSR